MTNRRVNYGDLLIILTEFVTRYLTRSERNGAIGKLQDQILPLGYGMTPLRPCKDVVRLQLGSNQRPHILSTTVHL